MNKHFELLPIIKLLNVESSDFEREWLHNSFIVHRVINFTDTKTFKELYLKQSSETIDLKSTLLELLKMVGFDTISQNPELKVKVEILDIETQADFVVYRKNGEILLFVSTNPIENFSSVVTRLLYGWSVSKKSIMPVFSLNINPENGQTFLCSLNENRFADWQIIATRNNFRYFDIDEFTELFNNLCRVNAFGRFTEQDQPISCQVLSNFNISPYIKELVLQLPNEYNYLPGGDKMPICAIVKTPIYENLSFESIEIKSKNSAFDNFMQGDWKKIGADKLSVNNIYPALRPYYVCFSDNTKKQLSLRIRIGTPPYDRETKKLDTKIPPGITSSYLFSLKTGDKLDIANFLPMRVPVIPKESKTIVLIVATYSLGVFEDYLIKNVDPLIPVIIFYSAQFFSEIFEMGKNFEKLKERFNSVQAFICYSVDAPADLAVIMPSNAEKILTHEFLKKYFEDNATSLESAFYIISVPPGPEKHCNELLIANGVSTSNILITNALDFESLME